MTIAYIEKGDGLHATIRKSLDGSGNRHWLREENGVWISSDDAAVQAIINAYDPLIDARAFKWDAIKAERDRRQLLGVRVGANLYHSDDKSRIQQMGLVMMGSNLPSGLQWKTLSGAFVTMTPTLAMQIFGATAASDQAVFGVAEKHRGAMLGSSDPANYDISAGWPVA